MQALKHGKELVPRVAVGVKHMHAGHKPVAVLRRVRKEKRKPHHCETSCSENTLQEIIIVECEHIARNEQESIGKRLELDLRESLTNRIPVRSDTRVEESHGIRQLLVLFPPKRPRVNEMNQARYALLPTQFVVEGHKQITEVCCGSADPALPFGIYMLEVVAKEMHSDLL